MKTTIIAVAAALSLATAIPAFADSGDNADRVDSANSLPSGFYTQTLVQLHQQLEQEWIAGQTQAPAATTPRGTTPTQG